MNVHAFILPLRYMFGLEFDISLPARFSLGWQASITLRVSCLRVGAEFFVPYKSRG